jgi:hypothetical protein
MTSPVNDLIRGTAASVQEDPQAAALVGAARTARFHRPEIVLDLVADDARQDPQAAVQALVRSDPTLVRRTDAGAGEGSGADALPSSRPEGQHPFSAMIRRHWQSG